MRGPIMFHDERMIDGQIGGTAAEFAGNRIAARLHGLVNEAIRFGDCGLGIVHKFLLNFGPLPGKPIALAGRKRADLEILNPFLAVCEFPFGFEGVPFFTDNPVVLGSESGSEFFHAF